MLKTWLVIKAIILFDVFLQRRYFGIFVNIKLIMIMWVGIVMIIRVETRNFH